MREVVVLVARAELEHVALHPRVVRIRRIAHVERSSAVVADDRRKRQEAPPARHRNDALRDVTRVGREIAIHHTALVAQASRHHGEVRAGARRDLADPERSREARVVAHPGETHRRGDQADVGHQRVRTGFVWENGDMTYRRVGRLDTAGLVVEVPDVLLEDAEGWIGVLVDAGVAGALEHELGIGGEKKRLLPKSADPGKVGLDLPGRVHVRHDVRGKAVGARHEIVAVDALAPCASDRLDVPRRLRCERQRSLGWIAVDEAPVDEAVVVELHVVVGAVPPEGVVLPKRVGGGGVAQPPRGHLVEQDAHLRPELDLDDGPWSADSLCDHGQRSRRRPTDGGSGCDQPHEH